MRGWKLTVRTAPGALVAAEYDCPVHGRFAVDVPRDASGDPPAEITCTASITEQDAMFSAHSYRRDEHKIGRVGGVRRFTCGLPSPFVISAPARCKVKLVEAAVRGKDQKPEHKTWSDMTNLMEGQDVDEWREDRERKVWDDERHKAVKEILNG